MSELINFLFPDNEQKAKRGKFTQIKKISEQLNKALMETKPRDRYQSVQTTSAELIRLAESVPGSWRLAANEVLDKLKDSPEYKVGKEMASDGSGPSTVNYLRHGIDSVIENAAKQKGSGKQEDISLIHSYVMAVELKNMSKKELVGPGRKPGLPFIEGKFWNPK